MISADNVVRDTKAKTGPEFYAAGDANGTVNVSQASITFLEDRPKNRSRTIKRPVNATMQAAARKSLEKSHTFRVKNLENAYGVGSAGFGKSTVRKAGTSEMPKR